MNDPTDSTSTRHIPIICASRYGEERPLASIQKLVHVIDKAKSSKLCIPCRVYRPVTGAL